MRTLKSQNKLKMDNTATLNMIVTYVIETV